MASIVNNVDWNVAPILHATPAAANANEEPRKDEAGTNNHHLDQLVEKHNAERSSVSEEVENEKRAEIEERREKKPIEDKTDFKTEVCKPCIPAATKAITSLWV